MLLLSNWMIFEKEMDMSLRNYILLSFDAGISRIEILLLGMSAIYLYLIRIVSCQFIRVDIFAAIFLLTVI